MNLQADPHVADDLTPPISLTVSEETLRACAVCVNVFERDGACLSADCLWQDQCLGLTGTSSAPLLPGAGIGRSHRGTIRV